MDDINLDSNVLFSFLKQNSESDYGKIEDTEEKIENDVCIDGNECDTISDKGLMVCRKCGKMSQKIIEHGAEWRYYGGDDNQGSDPTRCGMPVNPLLKESSYGCKVLCPGNSSYEMKKIRKYTEWQSMP